MERPSNGITKRRAFALVLVLVFIFAGFSLRLFQVEIVEGKAYAELASKSSKIQVPITASRGEILDRYLRPLVVNRTSFSVVLDYAYFPHSNSDEDQAKENQIILSLTDLLTSKGCTWNDTLPISKGSPYTFEDGRENSISNLKSKYRLSDTATADQCMAALAEEFDAQDYTAAQQRTIVGVRYEIDNRDFSLSNPFTFSTDINEDAYNIILENSDQYPGVDVETSPVRQYVDGTIAPQLMGTVGPIYAEEYAELKDKGYQLNDTVGKSGIESAEESVLRGTNGVSTIYKDSNGTAVDKEVTTPPVPGSTVILTLDSELQKSAQDALNTTITQLRASGGDGHDVRSGSVVMIDTKTGGVLACASWPNYDLSTYYSNYTNLVNDPDKPLLNRALQSGFACGSTMKPCIALAGLTEGVISPSDRPVNCNGRYYRFKSSGLILKCMGSHGSLNVIQALAKSCNVFFYDLGYRLGIDKIDYYATQFGLGQKTGIEVDEISGVLSSPAEREAKGGTWSGGDVCTTAIGQSDNLFTPIQLATYAGTIANNGVRLKTHIVKSIRNYDGSETEVQPEVAATVQLSQTAIDTVREGMIEVAKSGTAVKEFRGFKYPIACKTGTAQVSNNRSDHGVFIGYASSTGLDDPQVAIAVVLEDGTSHPAARVARTVLDAYFSSKQSGEAPTPENELLQ